MGLKSVYNRKYQPISFAVGGSVLRLYKGYTTTDTLSCKILDQYNGP